MRIADGAFGSDPYLSPATTVLQLRDVGCTSRGGDTTQQSAQIVLLLRGGTTPEMDGFDEREEILRQMHRKDSEPVDALFTIINGTTTVDDTSCVAGVTVLISTVTEISGSNPTDYFTVASGGVASVRTVETNLAAKMVSTYSGTLPAILSRCEPYTTHARYGGVQAAVPGDVLYVFPMCVASAMDHAIQYIPVLNLTPDKVQKIEQALRTDKANIKSCMNRVFRIGQILLAADRNEDMWKVNLCPGIC